MSSTNRTHASERMTRKNPMHVQEIRDRMSATLRAIGHKPPMRGGNGSGMTEPQRALLGALGHGWEPEFAVKTKKPRGSGFPPVYKVDIANPTAMVAIEVDGFSHTSLDRKARDAKKTALLESLGWTVLRFSNAEAMGNTSACVRTAWSTTLR